MIIGIGVDMIRIDRIRRSMARFGDRFLTRVFTAAELAEAKRRGHGTSHNGINSRFLATRFAGKEAVWKAVNGGRGSGPAMKHIEITSDAHGKPQVTLSPAQDDWRIDCSLSDADGFALAFVVVSRHYGGHAQEV